MNEQETNNTANSSSGYDDANWGKFKDDILKKVNVKFSVVKDAIVKDIFRNSNIIESSMIGRVPIENIKKAMVNPVANWRTLLRVSDSLMKISPHYFRLNSYFSNMALCLWGLDISDVKDTVDERMIKAIKKSYLRVLSRLDMMKLKHEFSKIMKVLPYQDVFYGLIAENDADFFIQPIHWEICRLQQIQDGLYNFKINLAAIKPQELGAYPDYVQEAYELYVKNGKDALTKTSWYIPPAEKQICIKMNSQWTYPFPMLIGILPDIFDLDVYKKLKLQSARTDNYKAIAQEVPISNDKVDMPMITDKMLLPFAEINRDSLSDDIGFIYTLGSEAVPISFKNSSNTRNNVSDAIDEIYNSSGVSKELYNGSSSGTAVTMSVENDSGFIYSIYRQFERWVNRYIKLNKYNKANYKFEFYMLDATVFNRDNVTKRYKDAVALGVTAVDKWLASIDVEPTKVLGSYIIHNNIFDYKNNFSVLESTYNSSSSGDGEAGRPTAESEGEQLSDSGEQTKDSDSNIDR